MSPYSLSSLNQTSGGPEITNWFENMLFTVVAKLKVRAHTLSEVGDKHDYVSRVQIKSFQIHFGEMDHAGRASVV